MTRYGDRRDVELAVARHREALAKAYAHDGLRIAAQYKRKYDQLLNSRFVRSWLRIREAVGKPYNALAEAVPQFDEVVPECGSAVVDYLLRSEDLHAGISESNGCSYYRRCSCKIGIICDQFAYESYKDAIDLVYLSPENHRSVLDSGEISFVLYVTAWRGLGYFGAAEVPEQAHYYGMKGFELSLEVLRYAKSRGIPVAFQSKEDPSNYHRFLDAAKLADAIFTSAVEKIEDYRRDTGNDNVRVLEFGVNPLMHNPIGFLRKERRWSSGPSVLFAGAWYNDYPKRCADAEMIFDGIAASRNAGLYIADRNYFEPNRKRGVFPSRYERCLMPQLPYDELQKAYKCFDVVVNLNSITTSNSMCAMRLYEAQAAGSFILSNESEAVSSHFPSVRIVSSLEDVVGLVEGYSFESSLPARVEGLRTIMEGNTVYDRLNEIFSALSLSEPFPDASLCIVADSSIGVEGFLESQHIEGVEIEVVERSSNMEFSDGMWLLADEAFVDNGQENPWYLADLVNAFKYVDVDCVAYSADADFAGYDYRSGLYGQEGTLFNARHIGSLDAAACESSLDGFALRCV